MQGEGIRSPLAPSLLVASYNTQRIHWCYSYDVIARHHRVISRNNAV